MSAQGVSQCGWTPRASHGHPAGRPWPLFGIIGSRAQRSLVGWLDGQAMGIRHFGTACISCKNPMRRTYVGHVAPGCAPSASAGGGTASSAVSRRRCSSTSEGRSPGHHTKRRLLGRVGTSRTDEGLSRLGACVGGPCLGAAGPEYEWVVPMSGVASRMSPGGIWQGHYAMAASSLAEGKP